MRIGVDEPPGTRGVEGPAGWTRYAACYPQQGPEGREQVIPAIEPEAELVEISLQVPGLDPAVEGAGVPGLEVGEGQVQVAEHRLLRMAEGGGLDAVGH